MDTEAAFVHPEEHVDSADAGIAHLSPSEQNTIETGLEVEEKVPRDELASVEHDDGGEEQSDSVEEEELEEVYEEGSDTDEMDEEEDEDDECNYIPEEEQGTSPLPPQSREVPSELRIASRCYSLSSLVPNEGLTAALRKLRGNPKAVLSLCTLATTHNILKCSHLHLTNRAILIGDRYVRVNMLVHNAARDAILSKPTSALNMEFCTNTSTTHDPATCQQLHLLSKVVFVGVPGLRTGYFEAELHSNLGLTHTLAQSWDDQCGSWCRNGRSHVITTCKYLHYKRESRYSEKPKPPSRPQPLIANLTPKRPSQEGDNRHQRGGRGGRGRGGRGGGRGRGGRGAGPAGRGLGRGRTAPPIPPSLRTQPPPPVTVAPAKSAACVPSTAAQQSPKESQVRTTETESNVLPKVLVFLVSTLIVLLALIIFRG